MSHPDTPIFETVITDAGFDWPEKPPANGPDHTVEKRNGGGPKRAQNR